MEYYLGIDIGTTAVKSIAFSRAGEVLSEETAGYAIHHPYPDWSEQDPEEIASAVFKTVENILHAHAPILPTLCCFSAAMHSLIAVDSGGKALSPSIIWADNRAEAIASGFIHAGHAAEIYGRSGLPVHAMSPFCKVLWMQQNQPDLFAGAAKFIGIKEYIFFKLFGIYVVDASIAAATGWMNLSTRAWDPVLLELSGMQENRLSEIVESDAIFYGAGLFPQLSKTPWVIGASDGAMANIGTSDEPGVLVITVGTSSAARVILDAPKSDPGMRTFCYYLKKNQYLSGGASNNGGIVLQWLLEDFFQTGENMADFTALARRVGPGSGGLLFLPYLLGERAPIWNPLARSVLFGLNVTHGKPEMVRAAMEGVIYCLYDISQALLEAGSVKRIFASGGFARSGEWIQILADVFSLPVVIGETIENSAWGAAKWGMQAMGIACEPPAQSKLFQPNPAAHAVYATGYKKFQRLYELLKQEF